MNKCVRSQKQWCRGRNRLGGIGGRVSLGNRGGIEAHCRFLGFARNDKKESVVERGRAIAGGRGVPGGRAIAGGKGDCRGKGRLQRGRAIAEGKGDCRGEGRAAESDCRGEGAIAEGKGRLQRGRAIAEGKGRLQRGAAEYPGSNVQVVWNWRLLIFSDLILESRVDAGIPRRAAAPVGPETRPLV